MLGKLNGLLPGSGEETEPEISREQVDAGWPSPTAVLAVSRAWGLAWALEGGHVLRGCVLRVPSLREKSPETTDADPAPWGQRTKA